jgi:hypothetical protein
MAFDGADLGGLGPAQAPEPTGRAAGLAWLELVATLALAVLFALLGAEFALQAVHVGNKSGSRIPSALAAAGFVLVAAICTRVAISAEHRRLGRGPSAHERHVASVARHTSTTMRATGTPHRSVSGGTAFASLLHYFVPPLAAVALFGAAIDYHSKAAHSSFVQSHGLSEQARITSISVHQSCGRSSCDYTADMSATFPLAAGGTSPTDVHVPNAADAFSQGETVSILVDQNEYVYAEIPGEPFERSYRWIFLAVLGALLAAYAGWNLTPKRRRTWTPGVSRYRRRRG